ncbi:hypothetical protein K1T71_007262 [Dendrolimus kikuchii]|uniref:Uncharacterized protein n=1 Tax=Dendrolimus kikuchii TaxID=765133 RepID=A0ACC1D0Z6_9NEOP|nr:hypothetical protein K1T71_007262 [Dendrolimus kikuchii]
MSKESFIFCFISLIMLSYTGALKEHCNREENLLQRCSMALPVLSSPEISFALTREELDKSCIELRAGIKCIDNYTNVCMEKQEKMMFLRIYAGITEVVHELCTRGKYQDEFLKHADCVKKVRSKYEICSQNYELTLTTLNQNQHTEYQTDQRVASTHEDYLRTVCCSFQEYLMCSEQTVQRSCGDEAALFTSQFLKRMASNIIKNFCFEYRGPECGFANKASPRYRDTLYFLIGVNAVHLALYSLANLVPT